MNGKIRDGKSNAPNHKRHKMRYNIRVKVKLGFTLCIAVILLSITNISAQEVKEVVKNEVGKPVQYVGHDKDQVVDLGFLSQKKDAIIGAIDVVSGEELEKSPTINLQQALEGRLSGLITWENGLNGLNQPNIGLYLRGGYNTPSHLQPAVMIDGMFYSRSYWDNIHPSEIESITLLKDASSLAIYGLNSSSGLLVIKTKRGNKGKLSVKVNLNSSMKDFTLKPLFINSLQYAKLRNQAAYNVNPSGGKFQRFSETQLKGFESGQNSEQFPNNNWYDMFMKPQIFTQSVNTSVKGGNDVVQGFSTISFHRQGGVFKTDTKNNPELVRHDGDQSYIQANFRTNLDITINKHLSSYVRVAGGIINQNLPFTGNSVSSIYASLFNMPSTIYGPLTPANSSQVVPNQVVVTSYNRNPTYGELNRTGYQSSSFNRTSAQIGLKINLESFTKGLSAEGAFGYQSMAQSTLSTTTDYQRWRQSSPNELTFLRDGTEDNTPFVYSKGNRQYAYDFNYIGKINYERSFADFSVQSMAFSNYQRFNSSMDEQPNSRLLSGINMTGNYDNRYMVRLDLGYSGSDAFMAGNRFYATPSVAAGWTISNEKFMENFSSVISDLKLRASYGLKADDNFDTRNPYSDDITLNPRIASPVVPDLNIGYGGVTIRKFGNPNLRAQLIKVQNYGIVVGLLNSLTLSFDYFKDRSENLYITDLFAYPAYGGFSTSVAPQNSGVFERYGFELEIEYKKQFSKDLTLVVGGMLNYADNLNIYTGEIPRNDGDNASSYYRPYIRQGYSIGQQFGYRVDYSTGNPFFTQEEIDNLTIDYSSVGTPIAGCLKYTDLNGDGKIDIKDQDVISTGGLPKYYYAFNGEIKYKKFELSFAFQGVAKYTSLFGGTGIYDPSGEGTYSSWHLKSWTKERFEQNPASITYPVLMEGSSPNRQPSDFYVFDRSYLRLKLLKLSYTLQDRIVHHIGADNCTVSLSGINLLNLYSMKVNTLDPENGGYTKVPPYRVFNIGLSLNF